MSAKHRFRAFALAGSLLFAWGNFLPEMADTFTVFEFLLVCHLLGEAFLDSLFLKKPLGLNLPPYLS